MVANETMIRIKPEVWELIQFEKKLGESMSQTIGRVFQERFDIYQEVMEEFELQDKLKKESEGEKHETS